MTRVHQRGHDEEKPPTFVGSSEADCEITLCGYMELRVPRDVLQERDTVVRGGWNPTEITSIELESEVSHQFISLFTVCCLL